MTKRDALAKEIDYYQDPTILRQEFIGNLSGKSLIHIANEIQKEDQNQIGFGPSNIRFFRNVEDIKEYGINHPDEQVAQVYVFGGDFVHYNRGKTEKWEIVVYIPKLDRLMSVAGRHIKDIYSDIDLNSDNYKWFWSLPIYNDKPLN